MAEPPRPKPKNGEPITRPDLPNPLSEPPPPRERTLSGHDLDAIAKHVIAKAEESGAFRPVSSTPPAIRRAQKLLWRAVVEHWQIKVFWLVLGAILKLLQEVAAKGWHP